MKRFINILRIVGLLGMMLFFAYGYSQNEITQVNFNTYESVEHLSDNITQIGYFKVIDGKLVKDGIWKLIRNDEIVQKAYYKNDKFMWIECHVKGKFTKDQLQIEKLKLQVEKLEEIVAANNE